MAVPRGSLLGTLPPASQSDPSISSGNLPTEKVSKRDLFRVFHKYGPLAQISLKQVYGFVQFLEADVCRRALETEQGKPLRSRKMRKWAPCRTSSAWLADATTASQTLKSRNRRGTLEIPIRVLVLVSRAAAAGLALRIIPAAEKPVPQRGSPPTESETETETGWIVVLITGQGDVIARMVKGVAEMTTVRAGPLLRGHIAAETTTITTIAVGVTVTVVTTVTTGAAGESGLGPRTGGETGIEAAPHPRAGRQRRPS